MNHCSALQPEAEKPLTAAGSAPAGSAPSSSSSGSPSSWPPPPTTSTSTSFFRQLFSEDDDSAVAVAAGDSSSFVVDDLLLPPATTVPTAFDDDVSTDPVFQLGAFSMVDNFMNTRVPSMSLSEHTALSGQPHTLEFVSQSYSNSCSRLSDADQGGDSRYQLKSSRPRLDHTGGDDEESVAAKKAKLEHVDQARCSSGGTAVDPSQLLSIINKVNQSQSARSKEKLGERINALQQLVSPFGKTDTASVLSEAIGYIKFLQEQVQVLSSPYMKPTSTHMGSSRQQDMAAEGALSDLRSRGLCLVPVSCTVTVANNNNFNIGADYWASTPNLSATRGSGASTARFSATT